MKFALLIQFDTSDGCLDDQVCKAALRFRDKFAAGFPDTCQVHPSRLAACPEGIRVNVIDDRPGREDDGYLVPGCVVQVLPDQYIQPNQLLIGQKGQP